MNKTNHMIWLEHYKAHLTMRLQETLMDLIYKASPHIEIASINVSPDEMGVVIHIYYKGTSTLLKTSAPKSKNGVTMWLEMAVNSPDEEISNKYMENLMKFAEEMSMVLDTRNNGTITILGGYFHDINSPEALKNSFELLWKIIKSTKKAVKNEKPAELENYVETPSAMVN